MLALAGMACSPSMFWSGGRDPGIQNQRSYRKINESCRGVNLSHSQLDVPTTRELVRCLNSTGELDPAARLIARWSDAELQSILDVANRNALSKNTTLFSLTTTWDALRSNGTLDESLNQLGRLLENEEFVASGLALLKEGVTPAGHGERDRLIQADVLKTLEIISEHITPDGVADLLDLALSFAGTRSWPDLQSRLQWEFQPACDPSHAEYQPSRCELRKHTNAAHDFFRAMALRTDGASSFFERILDGSFFAALDEMIGVSAPQMRDRVGRVGAALHLVLEHEARGLGAINKLFGSLNREVVCFRGAQNVRNGVRFVLGELARQPADKVAAFIQRDNRLVLQALNAFCEYPPELATYYPSLAELADQSAVQPLGDLIRAFHRPQNTQGNRPLLTWMVDFLADPALPSILPTLAALDQRQVWDDLILLLAALRPEERPLLQRAVKFLSQPRAELSGKKSIAAVFADAFVRADPEKLYRFVYSMRHFLEEPRPMLEPALTVLRRAFFINDAHPLIEIVRSILAEASQNSAACQALFGAAEFPEFRETIRLFSQMARKEDGRLKELLAFAMNLFRRFAAQGSFPIQSLHAPEFVPKRSHDWSATDLVRFLEIPLAKDVPLACEKLDPRVRLSDTLHPQYSEQWDAVLACVQSEGRYGDAVRAVDFLRKTQLDGGSRVLDTLVHWLRDLPLSQAEMKALTDRWLATIDDRRFFRVLRGVSLVLGPVSPGGDSWMRPALALLRPVVRQSWAEWKRSVAYLASLVRDARTFAAVEFVMRMIDGVQKLEQGQAFELEPTLQAPVIPVDRGYLGRFVESKECQGRPRYVPVSARRREERVDEILYDFKNAANDWELVNGRARAAYELAVFRERLTPVLDRFGQPEASDPKHHVVDGLLNVIRYFGLQPGEKPTQKKQFERSYLGRWLHERSGNPRVIEYFYPGEVHPRVRLVSSLDMLNLVLIEAVRVPVPIANENLGLKFIKEIGEAWGDEDPALWPDQIRKQFAGVKAQGRRPKTLREAVTGMIEMLTLFEGVAGFPERPLCPRSADVPESYQIPGSPAGFANWVPGTLEMKSAIHNIRQVMAVLVENLPDSGHPHAGGIRVLRNLFFEMYASTPRSWRCNEEATGWEKSKCFHQSAMAHNNLSVVVDLVKLGLTRGAGRLMLGAQLEDPALQDFLGTLIDGAQSGALKEILIQLSSQEGRGRELFWKIMGDFFDAVDSAKGLDVPRLKQAIFYLLAAPQLLARFLPPVPDNVPAVVADRFLTVIAALLREHTSYLADHWGSAREVFQSRNLSLVLRALYQSDDREGQSALAGLFNRLIQTPRPALDLMRVFRAVVEDSETRRGYDLVQNRWEFIRAQPEYQELQLGEVRNDVLRFLAELDGDPALRQSAGALRLYLAGFLESADADALIRLAASKSEKIAEVLETLARYSGPDQEIWRLVELARRALSVP